MPIIHRRRPFLQLFFAECYDCASPLASTVAGVQRIATRLVRTGKFKIVRRDVWQIDGRIIVHCILAESHCFVEARPDLRLVLVEIMACTRFNERAMRRILATLLKPRIILTPQKVVRQTAAKRRTRGGG